MEPENIQGTPHGVESLPMPPVVGAESTPTLPPLEKGIERGQERFEQVAEAGARASDAAALAGVTPQVPPSVPQQQSQPGPSTAASSNPLIAADEDLIEKEWVDKAKEIIEQTKDDPHARNAKVNELQRDYLQKRYGKVIGQASH